MTNKEWIRAAETKPTEYPQDMPCAVCGNRWMQHKGLLCPSQVGGLIVIDGVLAPVEARFPLPPNATTFIPDVAWQNPNPDFDVV